MIDKPATHYNDWPNTQGFDTSYVEESPVELGVEGTIPPWVSGTLFRPGPGPREVSSTTGDTAYRVSHWFDFLCQVHRFQIVQSDADGARVIYNSRIVVDGLIKRIRERGKLDGVTFARKYDPCMSLFAKLQTFFHPGPSGKLSPEPDEVNVCVTVSKNFPGLSREGRAVKTSYGGGGGSTAKMDTLFLKTDASIMQSIDPDTLEPVGIANQTTLHRDLRGGISASHAQVDPRTGDVFNFNLDFGLHPTYRVFRVCAATGQTSILATFSHAPAYLHSLFITENYVILCVWNSSFRAYGLPILWNQNILDALTYDTSRPAKWFVIDKHGRGVVATYESDPFFCFHTINAYEEDASTNGDSSSSSSSSTVNIIADLAGFNNLQILHKFYYDNLLSDSPNAAKWSSDDAYRAAYRQYKLPGVPKVKAAAAAAAARPAAAPRRAELLYTSSVGDCPELPTIHPGYATRRHRFVYGISDTGRSSMVDSLVKYDTRTHSVVRWIRHGHTPSEPIFIPRPGATEEDDGVVLTIVLDGIHGHSYLAVLDARNMQPVASAAVNGVVGFGFHGLYDADA